MCIPGVHEISTFCCSVGKLANCCDTEGFCQAWINYFEESIIGSLLRCFGHLCVAVFLKINRLSCDVQLEEACKIFKGFVRALCRAPFGGGILCEVPVFKIIDAFGKSFGDFVVGWGDSKAFKSKWTKTFMKYGDLRKTFTQFTLAVVGVGIGFGSHYLAPYLETFVGIEWSYFLCSLLLNFGGNIFCQLALQLALAIGLPAEKCKFFDFGQLVAAVLRGVIGGYLVELAIKIPGNTATDVETGCVVGVDVEIFTSVEFGVADVDAGLDVVDEAPNPTHADTNVDTPDADSNSLKSIHSQLSEEDETKSKLRKLRRQKRHKKNKKALVSLDKLIDGVDDLDDLNFGDAGKDIIRMVEDGKEWIDVVVNALSDKFKTGYAARVIPFLANNGLEAKKAKKIVKAFMGLEILEDKLASGRSRHKLEKEKIEKIRDLKKFFNAIEDELEYDSASDSEDCELAD